MVGKLGTDIRVAAAGCVGLAIKLGPVLELGPMVLAGLADGRGLDHGFAAARSVGLEGRPELDPSFTGMGLGAKRELDLGFVLRSVGLEGQLELGSSFTAMEGSTW